MIGYLNGAQVNYTTVNGGGGDSFNAGYVVQTQQPQTLSADATVLADATVSYTQADNALSAAAVALIEASAAYSQELQTLAAAAANRVASNFSQTQAQQDASADLVAAIAAMLDRLQDPNTVISEAEAEAIKAAVDYLQDSNMVSATATVLTQASADVIGANQTTSTQVVVGILSSAEVQQLSDMLTAVMSQFLIRKPLGSAATAHGQGSPITPRQSGSNVTVH